LIQKIKLNRGQILTRDNVRNILNRARMTFDYARFDLFNKFYITINFNRDRTITIATNTRDYGIWRQIDFLRTSYTVERLTEFVFSALNVLSKK